MNNEILYLSEFLASQKGNEQYIVYFEMDNFLYLTYRLRLEFRREGFKDNEIFVERDFGRGIVIRENWRDEGTQVESDWIGDALFIAQNKLAQMEWVEIK